MASSSEPSSETAQEANSRLSQLKSDPRFARFFADSFDVSQYIRDLLASTSSSVEASGSGGSGAGDTSAGVQARLDSTSSAEVSKAVTELGEVIRSQIITYKKPLLRQALNVVHLDKWLAQVRTNVQDFNDHFAEVRKDLREPFDALSQQGKQISKAHKVSRMLRSVNLFLVQLGRLKRFLSHLPQHSASNESSDAAESEKPPSSVEHSANLSYAATLIHEMLTLVETEGIRGIDVVDRELPWVSELKQTLQDRAIAWLTDLAPLSSKKSASAKPMPRLLDPAILQLINVPTLTEAVHVLYSFQSLGIALKQVIENRIALTAQQIQAAFDVSTVKMPVAISSSVSGQAGTITRSSTTTLTEQRRDALWTQLEALFRDTFPSHLNCMLTIHRALVSLWQRCQQHAPDDRSDAFKNRTTDSLDLSALSSPLFEESSDSASENESTLSYFLKRLIPQSKADHSKALFALINANDAGNIVSHVWNEVVENDFCEAVLRAARKAKQTEQILSTDFPRFLRLFYSFSEHASTLLERSGYNFTKLLRNFVSHQREQTQNTGSDKTPTSSHVSTSELPSALDHPSMASIKQFSFVKRPTTTLQTAVGEETSALSFDASHLLQASSHLSKMELLVGENLWERIGTQLQAIEIEYQKILVAQFFTPINALFAVSSGPSATSSSDKGSLEKYQIFGPLTSSGKSQRGGVVVGGRMLLPGEVILAISSKSDYATSNAMGRWVGGSPYICKWLSLVKSHFDSLQSASPALVRMLLPKFLMALNKSIKLFVLKTEEVISHEEEASQISEMPPISQRFNAAIYNAIASVHSFFHKYICTTISSQWNSPTTEPLLVDLAKSLASISALASQHLLHPIINRASNTISKCLFVDLHQSDWNTAASTSSLYLRTLQRNISHLTQNILPLFSNHSKLPLPHKSAVLEAQTTELAISIANDFILSISLIRHIKETIKMRIMGDITQIEQICQQLEQLFADPSVDSSSPVQALEADSNAPESGSAHFRPKKTASASILSGFKEILFADNKSIQMALEVLSSASNTSISAISQLSSLIEALNDLDFASLWHLVLLRAPLPENLSPHTQKNMSLRQYCDWLKKTPKTQVWNIFVWALAEARKTSQLPPESLDAFSLVEEMGKVLYSSYQPKSAGQ
jgi:hypothetical protein